MTNKYHDPDEGNRRYQRAMAQSLVAGLGREGAIAASADYGWEGVVKALLPPPPRTKDLRSDEHASAGARRTAE